ncbi:uncharacterized protein LOC105261609 [Musca domestica]|uniref:Uncharacterized protein LOC105261609 n=1 Tax=Musca domestica TaxID=7370 RepID=A0A9J7D6K5_MUSDO|nr:uncharacterized protein LOC105261609 [Musca domestica]
MFSRYFLIGLGLLACLAMVATQATYLGNRRHPTLPGHCFYEEYNLTIKVNQTSYPRNVNNCFKVFCRDDFVLRLNHCPRRANPCRRTDLSKPFPQCCVCI